MSYTSMTSWRDDDVCIRCHLVLPMLMMKSWKQWIVLVRGAHCALLRAINDVITVVNGRSVILFHWYYLFNGPISYLLYTVLLVGDIEITISHLVRTTVDDATANFNACVNAKVKHPGADQIIYSWGSRCSGQARWLACWWWSQSIR